MTEFKKATRDILISVVATLIGAVVIAKVSFFSSSSTMPDNQTITQEALKTLHNYCNGLNSGQFEAYTYFSPHVDRFYTMKNTTPAEINTYITGLFQKQYSGYTAHVDESTFVITAKADEYYEVNVIMYGDYFFIPDKKQFTNVRSKTELRFDKNYHIKHFRQTLEK